MSQRDTTELLDTEHSEHLEDASEIKQAHLELLETDDGRMVLRDSSEKEHPLVSIDFSEKAKSMVFEMTGLESQVVAQHMIHSAMQLVMQKQVNEWQALIYDEEPKHYS